MSILYFEFEIFSSILLNNYIKIKINVVINPIQKRQANNLACFSLYLGIKLINKFMWF
jgi:hypothetical protein